MSHTTVLILIEIIVFAFSVRADVSHYFAPEYAQYSYQSQHGSQLSYPVILTPAQSQLSNLYNAPAQSSPVTPTSAPATTTTTTTTTTEFILPEIIENRNVRQHINFIPLNSQYLPAEQRPEYDSPKPTQQSFNTGYHYPRPTAAATTTTTVKMTTENLPPIIVQDPLDVAVDDAIQQLDQQSYHYNAPSASPSEQQQQTLTAAGHALRLHIKEMRCFSQQAGYFRAVLKLQNFIGAAPTLDNDYHGKDCELKLTRSHIIVDMHANNFQQCGVHKCGQDLCLRIRFPAIRGMRTAADALLTLHCKTQDRMAVKLHTLKMNVANDVQARSIGTYAHGGAQYPFRTHVDLWRKSNNGFTQLLEPNGVVQLGEELLLRAHVNNGDGWNYTKLSDISLQRISAAGELQNNAQLITAQGCLNPAMRDVCAHTPIFDPPLGHKLAFRAALFEGMRSGDEIVMSLRITACLEQQDCQVSAQTCNTLVSGLARRRRRRRRRSATNATEISEISHISFRVVMPTDERVKLLSQAAVEHINANLHPNEAILMHTKTLALLGSFAFVISLSCLAIFVLSKLKNWRL